MIAAYVQTLEDGSKWELLPILRYLIRGDDKILQQLAKELKETRFNEPDIPVYKYIDVPTVTEEPPKDGP